MKWCLNAAALCSTTSHSSAQARIGVNLTQYVRQFLILVHQVGQLPELQVNDRIAGSGAIEPAEQRRHDHQQHRADHAWTCAARSCQRGMGSVRRRAVREAPDRADQHQPQHRHADPFVIVVNSRSLVGLMCRSTM